MLPRWSCAFRIGTLGTRRHRAGIIEVEARDESAARAEAVRWLAAKYHWLPLPVITEVKRLNHD